MEKRSKRDRFYYEVGQALFMNNMRSFINLESLEIDIHPEEDYFSFGDMEDTAREAINNPDKFLALETVRPSQSFKIMEAFVDTVKDRGLKLRLLQALERKKPFANFKNIIDNSPLPQNWFDFRDEAYTEFAKEWLEENADETLKNKIKSLPSVFVPE